MTHLLPAAADEYYGLASWFAQSAQPLSVDSHGQVLVLQYDPTTRKEDESSCCIQAWDSLGQWIYLPGDTQVIEGSYDGGQFHVTSRDGSLPSSVCRVKTGEKGIDVLLTTLYAEHERQIEELGINSDELGREAYESIPVKISQGEPLLLDDTFIIQRFTYDKEGRITSIVRSERLIDEQQVGFFSGAVPMIDFSKRELIYDTDGRLILDVTQELDPESVLMVFTEANFYSYQQLTMGIVRSTQIIYNDTEYFPMALKAGDVIIRDFDQAQRKFLRQGCYDLHDRSMGLDYILTNDIHRIKYPKEMTFIRNKERSKEGNQFPKKLTHPAYIDASRIFEYLERGRLWDISVVADTGGKDLLFDFEYSQRVRESQTLEESCALMMKVISGETLSQSGTTHLLTDSNHMAKFMQGASQPHQKLALFAYFIPMLETQLRLLDDDSFLNRIALVTLTKMGITGRDVSDFAYSLGVAHNLDPQLRYDVLACITGLNDFAAYLRNLPK